ncbi:MAG: formylglycine-generating enzyme family protein [Gemmataceae bacterium]
MHRRRKRSPARDLASLHRSLQEAALAAFGSPLTEAGRVDYETQHKKRIGRTFALAAKSVTVEQYRQFDKGYQLPAVYTRTADLPVVGTSWYQAAEYCNWLSEQEGIPAEQWCHETNAQRLTQEKVSATRMMLMQRHPLVAATSSSYFLLHRQPQVTALRKNYLSLTGYRLSTEAEMEYATRAGAITSRYYGEMEELLPKYAWYNKTSQEKTWPVGTLKPNDFGLFDVQGDVYTWCQERYKNDPQSGGKGKDYIEDT